MARPTSSIWLLAISFVGLLTTGCPPGGVGDPCIPEDEYQNAFSGYSIGEVNIESRSFQCETRVCLVNHFQGRVSCPYGQNEGNQQGGCKIPGTTGAEPVDQVALPVAAQYLKRRSETAVYCSCRCANAEGKTDDGARYCNPCPSGFECIPLIDDLQLGGQKQLAGSYCIRAGTRYGGRPPAGGLCGESGTEDCGPPQPFD
jgi:hypothetical protein